VKKIKLYSKVRIVKLIQNPDDYDGWKLNKRPPQIGDEGYLIDILNAKGWPDKYVVEKADPLDGVDIWLSDFYEEEIEPLE
jgi:hypothetical protein